MTERARPFPTNEDVYKRQDRAGVGDIAGQCAGGSGSGRSQIHLALDVAHAAHEVAVGGGDAALTLSEDAHVAAEAGAAGGGGDDAARVDEGRRPAAEAVPLRMLFCRLQFLCEPAP